MCRVWTAFRSYGHYDPSQKKFFFFLDWSSHTLSSLPFIRRVPLSISTKIWIPKWCKYNCDSLLCKNHCGILWWFLECEVFPCSLFYDHWLPTRSHTVKGLTNHERCRLQARPSPDAANAPVLRASQLAAFKHSFDDLQLSQSLPAGPNSRPLLSSGPKSLRWTLAASKKCFERRRGKKSTSVWKLHKDPSQSLHRTTRLHV